MTELTQLYDRVKTLFPKGESARYERKAYIKGFLDGQKDALSNSSDFYDELAEKLRSLWPAGDKDGKWPWRESVPVLSKRLRFIWTERGLRDKYSIEQCLTAARRYLAQFEGSTKYMQVLKYFIFKQIKYKNSSGEETCIYKSTLIDMLESSPLDAAALGEFFEDNLEPQGELV